MMKLYERQQKMKDYAIVLLKNAYYSKRDFYEYMHTKVETT